MKRLISLIALSVIIILATACSPGTVPTGTNPSSSIPAQDGAYPAVGTVFEGTGNN